MSGAATRRVVTTEQLRRLLEAGCTITLPAVAAPQEQVLSHYSEADRQRFAEAEQPQRIEKVEYLRDEPVQCISVDDPEHLYVTDDAIPTHNTSNIVFLKSTDDSMIETLEKMSGTRHETHASSKAITENIDNFVSKTEGTVQRTYSTEQKPLIAFNDMMYIKPNQNIIFRAGDAPMWNRNETTFPMAWRLFKNKIINPGYDYSLKSIPSMSTAMDFDVQQNQPDFHAMVSMRLEQARWAAESKENFKIVHDMDDLAVQYLDQDVWAGNVMRMIQLKQEAVGQEMELEKSMPAGPRADESTGTASVDLGDDEAVLRRNAAARMGPQMSEGTVDTQMLAQAAQAEAEEAVVEPTPYAEGQLGRSALVSRTGAVVRTFEVKIGEAFLRCEKSIEQDGEHFRVEHNGPETLISTADGTLLVVIDRSRGARQDARTLDAVAKDENSRVYGDEADIAAAGAAVVTVEDECFRFLASLPDWKKLAFGKIDRAVSEML